MGPARDVVDISSDEEEGFRRLSAGPLGWVSKLFDRVVVIGDSLEPPQKKGGSDGAGEADPGDEDCVVLDGDPDRPVAVARDMGAASDELEIVAVKGQPDEEATVYVGNLPYYTDSEYLAQLFKYAGTIESSEIIYNKETGQSRGFGFITMSTVEQAEKAVEIFHACVSRTARVEERRSPRRSGSSTSVKIYVGHLPYEVDDSRLRRLFSSYGEVVDVEVIYDYIGAGWRSRGFGFVTMATREEADDAIWDLDKQTTSSHHPSKIFVKPSILSTETGMSQESGNLYYKGKRVVEYERTPRRQPTITHRPLSVQNASGSIDHQTRDVNVGWKKQDAQGCYARLSNHKNTNHCDQLRMDRFQKKCQEPNVDDDMPHHRPSHLSGGTNCIDQHESTQSGDNQMLNGPSIVSAMDGDSHIDWLHSNPTYQQRTIPVRHESHVLVNEGMHFQESYLPNLVASSERKRHRTKEKYAGMTREDKDIVLRRKRAYKMRTEHNLPLSDQSHITQARSGFAIPSSSTSAIHRQPFIRCNRTVPVMKSPI
ncbi:hypothetical protein ZWY2020_009517 [Hordeum vulgare]|nr:hypothetical protein ZWY2020_009517 [Hordeum vulgare]